MTTTITGTTGVSQVQDLSVNPTTDVAYNQTWQDMIGSRALETSYTNTSGQPISVNVSAISTVVANITATVAGILLQGATNGVAGGRAAITFVVPNGASYLVSLSPTTSSVSWKELR